MAAAPSAFFTAKSDLRFLEAAALGLPVVADPVVYPALVHGSTRLHAANPDQAREHIEALVTDPALRHRLGADGPRVRRARAGDAGRRAPVGRRPGRRTAGRRGRGVTVQDHRLTADDRGMPVPSAPLCVIPSYLRTPADLDLLVRCLVSLWATAPEASVLVVDDGSPERSLLEPLAAAVSELGYELLAKDENEGFARTVNVGLRRALETGRDAVLVNADIEFLEPGWLDRMLARTDMQGCPAAVVGARLLYPNGSIQHAGIFLSLRTRGFWHRCQYGPGDLPEALVPVRCPVTAALQLIRHETLATVGLYDGDFRMCYEDVDYCLRVFASGRECIYEPTVSATHHESVFRSRSTPRLKKWQDDSSLRLRTKWAAADLTAFTPAIV